MTEKFKLAEKELSDLVAAKDWHEVATVATRLKYLQGSGCQVEREFDFTSF